MSKTKVTFKVSGMSCGGCSGAINRALSRLEGIEMAEANHEDGTTVVEFNEKQIAKQPEFLCLLGPRAVLKDQLSGLSREMLEVLPPFVCPSNGRCDVLRRTLPGPESEFSVFEDVAVCRYVGHNDRFAARQILE